MNENTKLIFFFFLPAPKDDLILLLQAVALSTTGEKKALPASQTCHLGAD